jgi:hypothetical protein
MTHLVVDKTLVDADVFASPANRILVPPSDANKERARIHATLAVGSESLMRDAERKLMHRHVLLSIANKTDAPAGLLEHAT